jgi:predicted methyltransferase
MRTLPLALSLLVAATAGAAAVAGMPNVDPALTAAVKAPTRTPANVARDQYRHPAETLAFFGVKPGQTVVEVWPAGGWYTEILAPYLKGNGTLYAADIWPTQIADKRDQLRNIRAKQAADPATYGNVKLAAFPVFADSDPKIPDGSVDVVVTFRNVHNWRMGYQRNGQDYSAEAFKQMFAMLKKGGTLGVEDHRLPESAPDDKERTSGYVKVSTVRRLAEAAGFKYVGESEVNANPKDTKDYPQGVWTLPPGLRLGAVDRDKYLAIGESDRMTLKFRKP